jgi:hypothetical protein
VEPGERSPEQSAVHSAWSGRLGAVHEDSTQNGVVPKPGDVLSVEHVLVAKDPAS